MIQDNDLIERLIIGDEKIPLTLIFRESSGKSLERNYRMGIHVFSNYPENQQTSTFLGVDGYTSNMILFRQSFQYAI